MAPRPVLPLTPDPVIDALKRDVDRTLLRANLQLSPLERLRKLDAALAGLEALRAAFAPGSPVQPRS
jgi:hypothetical protein